MANKVIAVSAVIIAVILVSGCVSNEQEKEITEITISGHGNTVYVFSFDLRKSIAIPSNDPASIREQVWGSDNIVIVFNGSSEKDNAYFRMVMINTIAKFRTFFAYEGKILSYDTFYFEGDQWYNKTLEKIDKPVFEDTVLWLLGPDTGADSTSVDIEGNIIYIKGTSPDDLLMAGDKFALIVMGVENIE